MTAPAVTALAEHAAAIRQLGKQTVENVVEIGRHLTEAKAEIKKLGGSWGGWLEAEFKWSDQQARRFMHIFERKSELNNLLNADLPVSALYLLAAPSTPEAARTEILERAQAGEAVPVAEVKRIVASAKDNQPTKKPRRELYPKGPPAASTATTFEVAAELKDLVATKAPGWTGAIAETQAEVNAAEGRFRDDGAPGHWLIVAPRERLVVDYRIIQWLLLTSLPAASSVVTHIEWVMDLCSAANKACCPAWVSERLTGKSHPQRPGMIWPRELPIPQRVPAEDIGPDSQSEAARLRSCVETLQAEKRCLELKIARLEREIADLKDTLATFKGTDDKWRDAVETHRSIIAERDAKIARLENENATLRARIAAPADDMPDILECLRRTAQ